MTERSRSHTEIKMKKLTLIFILISFLTKAGNPPSIIFKENKGQWPEKVLFGAGLYNTQFYVNKNSFNYCVYSMADLKKGAELHHEGTNTILRGHNYEVEFLGGDLNDFTKTDEQKEYYNYFLGNNKSKWANSIKAFGNLLFNEIYDGIDLNLYSRKSLPPLPTLFGVSAKTGPGEVSLIAQATTIIIGKKNSPNIKARITSIVRFPNS